jgi:1-acyl-sn-glycerol-3-phosphate acyltransferase
MIEARHSRMYDVFFNWYLHSLFRKDFSRVDVVGRWPVHEQSDLVIGNHVSWWDGFWVYYLNKRFLKKKLHVMMLESQLKHRRFLTRIGAFSIEPGSRDMVHSLNYSAHLLQQPGHLVVMYPQGEIASLSAGVLPFKNGVVQVIKKASIQQVLFYVALLDYFSHRKPVLTLYLGTVSVEGCTTNDLQKAYEQFYKQSLLLQAQKKE